MNAATANKITHEALLCINNELLQDFFTQIEFAAKDGANYIVISRDRDFRIANVVLNHLKNLGYNIHNSERGTRISW